METKETVFERNYRDYLEQLKGIDVEPVAWKLGVETEGKSFIIPFFKRDYVVSYEKIIGPSGKRPDYDICVILSKYVLLCPDEAPNENDWVSFRDLKDSGPLINYFTNDVERAIAQFFSGKTDDLKKAGMMLEGYLPKLDVSYDIAMQFDALPMIPVMMLFNDSDEEFPAKSSVLFERRVETYLDAECIAMLGRQLFVHLKAAVGASDGFHTFPS